MIGDYWVIRTALDQLACGGLNQRYMLESSGIRSLMFRVRFGVIDEAMW